MEKKQPKMIERVYCSVHFALMLDPRHAPKDGKLPVCVRLTHNYRQRYVLHGDKCSETDFSKAAKAGKGELYERRKEWERFFDHIYNSVKKEVDDGVFSIVAFRQPGEPVDGVTINRVFREYISNLEADGKSTTAHIYKYVLLKIEQYFGLVDADAVDKVFVNGFRRKMEAEGLSGTTQGIYLRHLRSVFNYGIYKEYMKRSQYPFSQGRYRSDSVHISAAKGPCGRAEQRQADPCYNYSGNNRSNDFLPVTCRQTQDPFEDATDEYRSDNRSVSVFGSNHCHRDNKGEADAHEDWRPYLYSSLTSS